MSISPKNAMTVKDNLSEWVNEYTQEMVRWALHKTSSTQLAEDLVQDTFLAAAEKLAGFKGESTPKTWLFSILNNKIVDHYRKKSRNPIAVDKDVLSDNFDNKGKWYKNTQPEDWQLDDSNLLDDEVFREILALCMEALPEQWNSCMKLKYLMNNNGEQICQELNISPSNFWQIIHRAKLRLRDCIETNWFKK
jgi:RNA polymerase sigma-70 factor (TIGR02943 family)